MNALTESEKMILRAAQNVLVERAAEQLAELETPDTAEKAAAKLPELRRVGLALQGADAIKDFVREVGKAT